MKKRKPHSLKRMAVGLLCACAVAATAAYLAHSAGEKMDEQEAQQLRQQVKSAAASCYASEGRFPQSLAYLVDHYGLVYDEERYAVQYDAFASNIMPDIDVTVRGDDRP